MREVLKYESRLLAHILAKAANGIDMVLQMTKRHMRNLVQEEEGL